MAGRLFSTAIHGEAVMKSRNVLFGELAQIYAEASAALNESVIAAAITGNSRYEELNKILAAAHFSDEVTDVIYLLDVQLRTQASHAAGALHSEFATQSKG
jgi:hypothetical protein